MTNPKSTTKSPVNLNLEQRINEIRKVVTYIRKEVVGEMRGASHWDIVRKLRPSMVKFGVTFIPVGVEVIETSFEARKEGGVKWARMLCKYQFRVGNIDDSEDFLIVYAISEGLDNADKGPGKAATYAAKTALVQLFNLEVGEDPDFDVIEVDPEIEPERAAKIAQIRELAAKVEPTDPDSVINSMLAAYGEKFGRKIRTIAAMPLPLLVEAIGKMEAGLKNGNGAAGKDNDDPGAALFPGSGEPGPKMTRKKAKPEGMPEERLKKMILPVIGLGLNEHEARPAVVEWMGADGHTTTDLVDDAVYNQLREAADKLTADDWRGWIPS